MDACRVMAGDRGGKVLVVDGYRYHRQVTRNDTIIWQCWRRRTCTVKIKTNTFNLDAAEPDIRVQNRGRIRHEHATENDVIQRCETRLRMAEATKQDPTRPIRRVFNTEMRLGGQGGGDRQGITFASVRSVMQRARATELPPVPATVDDVNINGAWGETWEGQRFLLRIDANWELAIFATDENLEKLQRCRLLYMDATFRCCPRPYKQLFTILGQVQGHVVPLVYALMTRRDIGHYRQVFQSVKLAVRQRTHHNWRPALIVSDFERALWTSIETELPRARLQGCYFHFTQSLFRKVQELGLAGDFRRSNRLAKFVRKVLAIGYVPIAVMMLSFTRLINQERTRRLLRRYPALQDFIGYFRRTYLGPQAIFPPASWSVSDRDMDQRTNNNAESFHKAFGTTVGVRRPNLWLFITVLKDRQAVSENSFEAARRGQPAPRRRRKWRILEDRLTTLKEEYNNGDRTLDEYWEAVSYLVHR